MSRIRMTYPTAMVLQALDAGYRYGFDIASVTEVRPGSVYQILHRLEEGGLVEGAWEAAELAHADGRPSRRYYRLTSRSKQAVGDARKRFPPLALPHRMAPETS
jgi:PadR family transcriptional regulator PadR